MKNKLYITILLIVILSTFSCATFDEIIENDLINSDIKFYKYEDLNIKYTEHGSGKTILFVHGLGASSFTWRYLYKYYSQNYNVISLDLKGFGKSSKPMDKNYFVSDQARIINSFISDMGLKDVTLVGNSFGGAVVLATFLSANEIEKASISTLILLDPAAYYQKKLPGYVALLRTPVFNRITLGLGNKKFITNIVLKQIFYNDDLITNGMISTYSEYLKGSRSHNALIETAKSVSSSETKLMSANYSKIKIPVLIIWGEFDNVIEQSVGVRLSKDISTSKLVIIDDCGHIPQEEVPDKTIDIINSFLKILF